MASIIVWDIETVPDLKGFAAANGHNGRGDDEISRSDSSAIRSANDVISAFSERSPT
jgi:hypothetical protein